MRKNTFSISLLNKSLRIFFFDALRIALKKPAQAYTFFQTIKWLHKAAGKRSGWQKKGIKIPPIIIFSITNKCNLQCTGCYAQALHGETESEEISSDRMRTIIKEARDLGVSFFVLAGGEPFMRQEILDITKDFPEIIFLVFTNGLLIDEGMLQSLKRQKNVIPLISLEGYEKETDKRRGEGVYSSLQKLMSKMRQENIFFGTSLTLTRPDLERLTSAPFIKTLLEAGCKFFLFLEYTPIQEGTENLVLTSEQRTRLMNLIASYRKQWPALFIAVPGDEAAVGGCLAAGRGFVHINAEGDLEPCPFAPFSDTNLKNSSLKDALQSELLEKIRQHPEILTVTEGGCALWKRREWVKTLL